MSRITRIKYSTFNEAVRNFDSGLFHALLDKAAKAEPGGEIIRVDSADIRGESFQGRWKTWVEIHPEAVLSEDSQQDELWQATQAAAKLEEAKAHVKKHADEAAKRFFEYWVAQRGLVNSGRVRNAIFEEFNKREKRGDPIPSAAHLDVVIELLNSQGALEWKPTEPAAPAPVELPPPVILSDGSHQLPLDVVPSTRHTVVQLKDWSERTRAAERAKVREHNNAVVAAFREANQPITLEVEA